MQVAGRPLGVFSRQLFLGDALDTEHIDADYDAGVLTLRTPLAERAKPRKVTVTQAESGPPGVKRSAQRRSHRLTVTS